MKGFKKDGKFRPTGNKSKSSLNKTDVQRNKHTVESRLEELKEQKKKRLSMEYDSFLFGMNDYGSGDVAHAVEFADEAGIDGRELSDIVREQAEELETPLEDVDINYIIYDHVLQMARNKIDEVIGYDFLNDNKTGGEIQTAGNYMATTYDYTEEAVEELQNKINEATSDERRKLFNDKITSVFFEYVEIEKKV